MDRATRTIIWIFGIIAIIFVLANWRRIISAFNINDSVGTNGTNGNRRIYQRTVDNDSNPYDNGNGQSVCKVTDRWGKVIEIKGDINDPEFERLCRYANSQDYYNPYLYRGYYYYPFTYSFIVTPRPGTGTPISTSTPTSTGMAV